MFDVGHVEPVLLPDGQQPSILFVETLVFLENKLLLFIYITFNTNNTFTC